jgi:hypothetical protein
MPRLYWIDPILRDLCLKLAVHVLTIFLHCTGPSKSTKIKKEEYNYRHSKEFIDGELMNWRNENM